jgi:transcriptional regulator with XRE-family HTH domain
VVKTTSSDPRISFGRAVKKFRLAAGLSQEKLAALAGIHRNYAGAVERGERNVAVINMCRIAKALSIPLNELVREMEKQSRKT